MALKGQDLLFLSLGDLQLPVDHIVLCVLIRNSAGRVGVVTAGGQRETCFSPHFCFKTSGSVSDPELDPLCHDHLHEHFQSRVAVPGSQTYRDKNIRLCVRRQYKTVCVTYTQRKN